MHRIKNGRDSCTVPYTHRAILIKTATIGYGRTPEFEVQPPNAPTPAQQIAYALLTPTNPLRIASGREGIDVNKTVARLLRPPMAANAARMIEWEKIGMEWKRLINGDNAAADVSTRVNITVDKEGGSGSGLRRASLDRKPSSESLQKRIQDHAHSGNGEGMEGLKAKMEEYKKQACECKEQVEENGEEGKEHGEGRQDAIPDMAKLGEFLDKTRDMVNERMEEVKSDEKKLAKARKTYPKIMKRVKKQLDRKVLFAMIPKQGQEGLKGSIEADKEGVKRGRGRVDDGEVGDQGIERGREGGQRGPEETKKYIGKGGDGHLPEQTFPRKREAKL
ncbi:hypothetical protein J3R82DRAFT_4863 [Butyriboletus roseoflavus]|nr:hypothetical protein J3R82DRAFT_4863 [Butyriboletus roseoflavus]